MENAVYEEGRTAQRDGFRIVQNPYSQADDRWSDWRRGWENERIEHADHECDTTYYN